MGRAGKLRAREQREKRLQDISLLRTIPYSDHQRWWNLGTIAVVTGSNRGIGFEIAKQLATHGVTVILTARDIKTGLEAAKSLHDANLNVHFHQLDITDHASVQVFAQFIRDTYGGIDILVNNAGVNFNVGSDNSVELAEQVITTNYFGTKNITEAMIPLMKPSASGARIVNVSSRLGRLNGRRNRIGDVSLREQLSNIETLKEVDIDNGVNSFIEQVKDGSWESGGWPQTFTDYSVSKLAVNCYTRMVARKLSNRNEGERIYINCYCPGWVKTAMTGWAGNISAEQAADTGVWLALIPTLPTNDNEASQREMMSKKIKYQRPLEERPKDLKTKKEKTKKVVQGSQRELRSKSGNDNSPIEEIIKETLKKKKTSSKEQEKRKSPKFKEREEGTSEEEGDQDVELGKDDSASEHQMEETPMKKKTSSKDQGTKKSPSFKEGTCNRNFYVCNSSLFNVQETTMECEIRSCVGSDMDKL